jgi:hypothetical protein
MTPLPLANNHNGKAYNNLRNFTAMPVNIHNIDLVKGVIQFLLIVFLCLDVASGVWEIYRPLLKDLGHKLWILAILDFTDDLTRLMIVCYHFDFYAIAVILIKIFRNAIFYRSLYQMLPVLLMNQEERVAFLGADA